jgi:hypothetical protein
MLQANKVSHGDCECCSQTDVELTLRHGDILMCPTCLEDDLKVVGKAEKVITDSRAQDATIELKQDLFNAGTVAFTELQAAIQANPEIPEAQKNYNLMVEVAARIEKLTAAIFSDEAALTAKKNERHALLVNAQNVAARLHEKEREKFKQYDINYKPVTPKSVKPKTVKTSGKKFSKTELFAAAKKYNVPAAQVQSISVARNMSVDDAAKHLAGLMGLL